MATITRKALKLGVVAGTLPAACIALGYRMRSVQATENNSQEGPRVYRACDLPIYNVGNKNRASVTDEEKHEPNSVEFQIGKMRRSVQKTYAEYKVTFQAAKDTIDIGIEHSRSTLDYVQNNPGELPRVAFITVGSLGGFILGYRGGIVRKVFYGSVTGVACAALCYPKMTVDLYQRGVEGTRQVWPGFNTTELMKGNWPFVADEKEKGKDEENCKKLKMRKQIPVKQMSNDVSCESQPSEGGQGEATNVQPPQIGGLAGAVPQTMEGDPGQAHPDDKDMYSTRGV